VAWPPLAGVLDPVVDWPELPPLPSLLPPPPHAANAKVASIIAQARLMRGETLVVAVPARRKRAIRLVFMSISRGVEFIRH
jgi:hypothetical protein